MVYHWSLSDSKPPQVSRTLLSILAALNDAVVWMVSTRPLISKPSSPCTNPLVTVPRVPITIGITVTFMFHSFFNSLARSRYLSFFSLIHIYFDVCRDSNVPNSASSLFLLSSIGLVVWPRSFVSQNARRVCASHSLGQILGCAYTICSYGEISIYYTIIVVIINIM